MGRRSVPPRSAAGLSTQPAHRRERPRSAPRETCSAPFKGSFTSVCRRRNDEPGRQRAGERVSERERGADRVTNTRDFECSKRVHDRVHDVVQIAGMAGGTKVAMHTYTEAVTAHVRSRASRAPAYAACGHGRRRSGLQFCATARAGQGCASPLPCDVGSALDPPARSRRGWLLPERRRGVSLLHLDLYAEFDHALKVVAGRKPWRGPRCAPSARTASRARWPSPPGASPMMVSRPSKYVTSSASSSNPCSRACSSASGTFGSSMNPYWTRTLNMSCPRGWIDRRSSSGTCGTCAVATVSTTTRLCSTLFCSEGCARVRAACRSVARS